MVTQKVKTRIDSIFPRWKREENSDRGFAREFGISHKTFQQYRKGQYWQQKEREWEQQQALLRKEESIRERDHLTEHGDRYRADLEAMQQRFSQLAQSFAALASAEVIIVHQALAELRAELERGSSPIEACHKIQRKGISATALDSTRLAKEAREQFAEAYGLRELLENLEGILESLR